MTIHQGFFKRKLFMGVTIGAGIIFIVIGIILWGGFNTVLELTNREEFCISCHEMKDNVYEEYKKTIHYANRSGVKATCPDCHVPKEWIHKIVRKIQASNEILHKVLGTIDTPEKFNSKRLQLAQNEWRRMKANDSRECRNCHDFESMSIAYQKPRARKQHTNALKNGNTCIDCHKGIAHTPVHQDMDEEELEKLSAPNPEFARPEATLRQPVNKKQQKLLDLSNNPPKPKVRIVTKTVIKEVPAECKQSDVNQHSSAAVETSPSATGFGIDWSDVPDREITVFYPGQSSMEWIFKGSEHGGKLPFKAGDRCTECHDKEAADMGRKIVTGEKLEPQLIPNKRGGIAVKVQAAHDADYLYMRYEWQDAEHTPVPFTDGGKMDPDNQVKIAMMFNDDNKREEDDFTGSVMYSGRAGCWATCHHDAKGMPDEPKQEDINAYEKKDQVSMSKGISKYLTESRTKVEVAGRRGKKRGGWNKLKDPEEIKAELDAGRFMDLIRYKTGTKEAENGYILAERVMSGGEKVFFTSSLDNGVWVIELKRKLKSDKTGDTALELDKMYNFGFAIHDDYTSGRFHHVSLGYKLGFDNEKSDINAVKRQAKAVVDAAPAVVAVKKVAANKASTAATSQLDWTKAPEREIVLFYPGQASMEWMFKGSEHGGKLPFKAGDRCSDCHDKEAADMGQKIVTGEKLEKQVIDGKRGSIPVTVQAMFDSEKLYMRFEWQDTEHTPVAFVDGGKMDPDNSVKLAMMFSDDNKREEDDFTGSVMYSGRAGCWATCHHDARGMPGAPKQEDIDAYEKKDQHDMTQGITKYLTESRTKVEIKGRRGKKLGGWNKLKDAEEIKAELDAGRYMDLIRYQAGTKKSENGYILADRVMSGGQEVEFIANLENGVWSVEMIRDLKSGKPGDINMEAGNIYNFGFAIHDDYSSGRFHHVSLGYKLGFNNDKAEVNAVNK
jgi:nitrate/TMAO reductase-like tetraheme cytochrome c subunit